MKKIIVALVFLAAAVPASAKTLIVGTLPGIYTGGPCRAAEKSDNELKKMSIAIDQLEKLSREASLNATQPPSYRKHLAWISGEMRTTWNLIVKVWFVDDEAFRYDKPLQEMYYSAITDLGRLKNQLSDMVKKPGYSSVDGMPKLKKIEKNMVSNWEDLEYSLSQKGS